MLIEVDHMSERARDRVLAITGRRDYPLVSSHTGTGGSVDRRRAAHALPHRRLRRGDARPRPPRWPIGSSASAVPTTGPLLRRRARHRHRRLLLAAGPGEPRRRDLATRSPATAAASSSGASEPASAPSTSNTDGVAHYGLFADLLDERADAARRPRRDADAVPLGRGVPADVGAGARPLIWTALLTYRSGI